MSYSCPRVEIRNLMRLDRGYMHEIEYEAATAPLSTLTLLARR